MNTEKTEAMRLASALIERHGVESFEGDAAAELRRLHQFAEDQIGRATAAEAALQMTKATHALKIAAVEAQRDALLEALQALYDEQNGPPLLRHQSAWEAAIEKARAAIKAVEGEKE